VGIYRAGRHARERIGHFFLTRRLLAVSTTVVVVLGGAIGVGAASAAISPAVSIHGTNKICGNDAHIDTVTRVDIRNNDDSNSPLCLTVWYHKPNFQITTSRVNTPWGAFPNAFIGCEISVCSPHSGLPMQVSNVRTASSTWHYHFGSGPFAGNAAYDIWFDPKPITSGQVNHGAEIMVWVGSHGLGSPVGTPVYIDGTWWDFSHWTASHGGRTWNYVRFWRQKQTLSVNLNLKNFFSYTENKHLLSSRWYLTAIETGYEICRGGYGIHTLWFSASVTPWKAPTPPPAPKPKPKPTPTIPSAPKPSTLPTSTPTPTGPPPSTAPSTTPPTGEPTSPAGPTDAPTSDPSPTDTPTDGSTPTPASS
jgi:hypothetical protein